MNSDSARKLAGDNKRKKYFFQSSQLITEETFNKMPGKSMDWKIIAILSVIGLVMGLLSVKGFTQKIEPVLWLLFSIATSLILSKNIEQKPFFHALLIGIAWGICNGVIQSAFFDSYLTNNPSLQQNFQKQSFIRPRYLGLVTGPIIGVITGLILGGLTLLLKKLW